MRTVKLALPTRPILLLLVLSFFLILSISFGVHVVRRLYGHDYIFGFAPFFSVDGEANLPAWLSSATLLFCSILAYSFSQQETGRPEVSRIWGLTAFILFLMAADEGAQIHELAFRLMGQIVSSWLVIIGLGVLGGVVVGAFVFPAPYCRIQTTVGHGSILRSKGREVLADCGSSWNPWRQSRGS